MFSSKNGNYIRNKLRLYIRYTFFFCSSRRGIVKLYFLFLFYSFESIIHQRHFYSFVSTLIFLITRYSKKSCHQEIYVHVYFNWIFAIKASLLLRLRCPFSYVCVCVLKLCLGGKTILLSHSRNNM